MKKLSVFTLILLFALFSFAQKPAKVQLNGSSNNFEVISKSQNGLTIKSTMSDLLLVQSTIKGGDFVRILSDDLIKIFDQGMPNLPVHSNLIEIPQDANVVINIVSYDEEIINLSDYGFTNVIAPAQPSISKSVDPATVPFYMNEQAYQTDDFLTTDIAVFEESGMMRATRFGRLEVRPFQYNPVKNQLKVLNNLVIEITFENANFVKTNELKQKYASYYFDGLLDHQLLNYDNGATRDLIQDVPVELVIVSDRMFEAQLQEFIEWKELKGFNVTTLYTDDIGSTTTAIKSALQAIYESDEPMDFVLFVGDVQQIPAWSGNSGSHVTDLRYCEYTGDDVAEVFYGRFSAQTTAQLQPQIDKTLMYEQYTMADPSYLADQVLVAGVDAGYATVYGNGAINYISDNYANAGNGINPLTYLYGDAANSTVMASDASGAPASIFSYMDQGVGWANYTAHCSEAGWYDPGFETSEVNSLTNDQKYGLWIGNCCLSVSFQQDECFGEAALRKANGGAIGDIGGSNSTYWDEDYWWATGVGTPVENPDYNSFDLGSYDAVYHTLANEVNNPSSWYVTQSQINTCGQLAVNASSSTRKQYYWEIYHLMGDPTLMPYLYVPDAMTYSITPDVLMIGSSTIDISTVPYATVAVHQDGNRLAVVMTDGNGDANISLSSSLTGGEVTLVITAQNHQPLIETLQPIASSEPYVLVSAYTPTTANYNTTTSLDLDFENVADPGYDAANVTATLTSSDPYITITDGSADVGTVNGGQTVTITDAFEVQIANNVPDQYEAELTVTITGDDAKYSWSSNIDLVINAPSFTIGSMTLSGDDDGNGRLDPGETADLTFTVNNTGHAAANYITNELSGNSPYFAITDNTIVNQINAQSSADVVYTVMASEGTPAGTVVNLTFDVYKEVYTAQSTEELTIGMPAQITAGTGTEASGSYPFYTFYENNKSQMLFLGSELGAGEITIQDIAFDFTNTDDEITSLTDFEINFKETTMTSLGMAYPDMTGATTVLSSASYPMPQVNGWYVFDTDNFTFDASQNLIVEIIWGDNGNYGAYEDEYKLNCTSTAFTSVTYGYADSETPPDYDGNSTVRPNVTFFFESQSAGTEYVANFTVTDGSSPITGATVTVGTLGQSVDGSGQTTFDLYEGTYYYTATANGYQTISNIEFAVDGNEDITIVMAPGSVAEIANIIKLYPNPTNGLLNIDIYNFTTADFVITDLLGKVVLKSSITKTKTQVDLSNLANGVYILNLNIDGTVMQEKIIVE